MVDTKAVLRCPHCGRDQDVDMPTNYRVYFYNCRHCGELLGPKKGDDCVFCSYADKDCPPKLADSS